MTPSEYFTGIEAADPALAEVVIRRIAPRLDVRADCWVWTGALMPRGYGQIRLCSGGKASTTTVHRVVAMFCFGPIPPAMHVDHLCRNRACANPQHLEVVTPAENTRRGFVGVLKEHCAQGHPWVPENWLVKPNGRKRCRLCHRDAERQRRVTAREAAEDPQPGRPSAEPQQQTLGEAA